MDQPPVLLVHGFGSSFVHGWQRTGWTDLLSDEGREFIGVDLPGHGESGRSADPADYQDVEAQVAAAASGHPVVDAVGFSAGADVLLRLAATAPQGFRGFRRLVLLGLGDGITEPHDASELIAAVENEVVDPGNVLARVFHRLARAEGNDPAALAAFLQRPSTPLAEAQLRSVDCPVLFLTGDRDPAGLPERLTTVLPDAALQAVPGADHFSVLTDHRSIQATLDFLGD